MTETGDLDESQLHPAVATIIRLLARQIAHECLALMRQQEATFPGTRDGGGLVA